MKLFGNSSISRPENDLVTIRLAPEFELMDLHGIKHSLRSLRRENSSVLLIFLRHLG
jgi:hypothetical protein